MNNANPACWLAALTASFPAVFFRFMALNTPFLQRKTSSFLEKCLLRKIYKLELRKIRAGMTQ